MGSGSEAEQDIWNVTNVNNVNNVNKVNNVNNVNNVNKIFEHQQEDSGDKEVFCLTDYIL